MNQNETQQKKITIFEEQNETLQKIKKEGFVKYTGSLEKLSDSFVLKDGAIRCIDEGTPGGMHSAGSGILRNQSEVVDAFKNAGVTEITSHDGCGAAKLYAKANGLDESMADEYGKKWSEEIANQLGVPHQHISASEMKRPSEFHIARTVYYDGTGKFDFGEGKELPPGFIISRKIQTKDDSLKETEVALSIAFGHHGFSDLITDENPFILVAIGETAEDTERLKKELAEVTHEYDKKVIIDGFTAPSF